MRFNELILLFLVIQISTISVAGAYEENATIKITKEIVNTSENFNFIGNTSEHQYVESPDNTLSKNPVQTMVTFNESDIPEQHLSQEDSNVSDQIVQILLPTKETIPNKKASQLGIEESDVADRDGKAKLAAIELFFRYAENQTPAQRKISDNLLQLIDPKYPKTGMSKDQKKL